MNNRVLRIAVTGLMAALCYISFTYLKISIPTPVGNTAFHLGNTFCVLAALLLGGVTGGLAGAIGMGIGDVLDPRYILVAPKTIVLKMLIGIIVGTMAHKVFKIRKLEGKKLARAVIVSATCGMVFNMLFEPVFGYFYYMYVMGAVEKAAKTLASWNAVTTGTNAILAIVISSALYLGMYKQLSNNGIIKKIGPKEK